VTRPPGPTNLVAWEKPQQVVQFPFFNIVRKARHKYCTNFIWI